LNRFRVGSAPGNPGEEGHNIRGQGNAQERGMEEAKRKVTIEKKEGQRGEGVGEVIGASGRISAGVSSALVKDGREKRPQRGKEGGGLKTEVICKRRGERGGRRTGKYIFEGRTDYRRGGESSTNGEKRRGSNLRIKEAEPEKAHAK